MRVLGMLVAVAVLLWLVPHRVAASTFSVTEYVRTLGSTPCEEHAVVTALGPGCLHVEKDLLPAIAAWVTRCYRDPVRDCSVFLTFERHDYGPTGDLMGVEFRSARKCTRSCAGVTDGGDPSIAGIRLGQRAAQALLALEHPLHKRTVGPGRKRVIIHEFLLGPESAATFLTVGVRRGRVVSVGFYISE